MLPEDLNLYNPLQEIKARCLVELEMMKMSQEIRAKPEWYEKVLIPEITEKWKLEAKAQGLSQEAIEYVINEVKYFATLKDGPIEVGPVPGTWQADGLIDDELSSQFKKIVAEGLENRNLKELVTEGVEPSSMLDTPEAQKDYHPGSGDLVVDLVHPSLYCYFESTSVLVNEDTIDEQFLPKPQELLRMKIKTMFGEVTPPSGQYRWLPAEVTCDKDGKITFDSYINNLHPILHKNLYEVLEKILQKFIPMFNRSLTDAVNPSDVIIDLSEFNWYSVFDTEGKSDEDYEQWERTREVLPMPIPEFKAPEAPKKAIDLKGEKLQVIVKLANIELTPEKPRYEGGAWHIEGIAEERIVASGIHYYEVENITESKLSFRTAIQDPLYEQYDARGVLEVFGLSDRSPSNQILGSLSAQQGRCIVFPNTYQHRVAPFELVDKTKPGIRKILVFFLVDPTVKVISTHNVLPQQPGWEDVEPAEPDEKRLPMTRAEAEELREKLMFERKYAREEFQTEYYEREFSLCEH